MISFAPELDLTAPVPGTANWAWVTVGRGDGGREELRDKLVVVEGEEKQLEERNPRLLVASSVSICLNFANGDIGLFFAGLLEGRGDEGVEAEEKEELGFARVGLDLMRGLVHFESVLPFFTSNPAPFSGTFSFSHFLSPLLKMLSQ